MLPVDLAECFLGDTICKFVNIVFDLIYCLILYRINFCIQCQTEPKIHYNSTITNKPVTQVPQKPLEST